MWVQPDGLVTAGAIADSDMLCWGANEHAAWLRLNVHVLTEMTLEYFRLADNLIRPRVPGSWTHRVVARRFQGDQPRALGPGGKSFQAAFLSEASPASSDSWDQSWAAVGEPERDAYEALGRIYPLFGMDVSTNLDVVGDRVPEDRLRST